MKLKHRRNWLFLTLLFLVGFIVIGYFLFIRKDNSQTADYSVSQENKAITPSPDLEQDSRNDSGLSGSMPTSTATPLSPTAEPISQAFEIRRVVYEVPFTAQAPLGEWEDSLQQDGCEEASALMAVSWARGEVIGSPQEARDKILVISRWEQGHYQTAQDTSARDTVERIFKGYFGYGSVRAETIGRLEEIIEELMAGHLVVTPMNGQLLGNPYYTQPGPERHMLVVRGYEPQTKTFITNDPGTRRGEAFRYDQQAFWQAIRDYPTGDHEPIVGVKKVMIVVEK